MKILTCLLLIILLLLTSGLHLYFVWKKKDFKTLLTQVAILGLTILFGILAIYNVDHLSISRLLNAINGHIF
ncbi:hypothetical protein JOD43_000718 [Pullulanibacillus pueri]|uniref:Uncharacterized protein n=1 Tax=Pullulanibacillus pueri TaxID=1437324 RepID=A0A8J3EP86_9BACL|nr:hypothetical protein [Pullulanibacillus pueri]GGH88418.1 hypothetical protein GCM10007096_40710 [Pullulanibacillus pueri]